MDPSSLTTAELVQGYHQLGDLLRCNYCQADFTDRQQVTSHLERQHGGPLSALLNLASKYNTLTPKQRELLRAFSQPLKTRISLTCFRSAPRLSVIKSLRFVKSKASTAVPRTI